MNEVEKLYENAEIKPVVRHIATGKGYYIEHQRMVEYPTFTTEKQISLIKLFVDKGMLLFTNSKNYKGAYKAIGFYRGGEYGSTIGEALASCICNNWQDLTEEERNDISGILRA